jgi:hypothetical protein
MYKNRRNPFSGTSSPPSVRVPREPEWHSSRGGQGPWQRSQWAPARRDYRCRSMCPPAYRPTAALGVVLLLIRWQLAPPSSSVLLHCCAAFYTQPSPRRVALLPGPSRRCVDLIDTIPRSRLSLTTASHPTPSHLASDQNHHHHHHHLESTHPRRPHFGRRRCHLSPPALVHASNFVSAKAACLPACHLVSCNKEQISTCRVTQEAPSSHCIFRTLDCLEFAVPEISLANSRLVVKPRLEVLFAVCIKVVVHVPGCQLGCTRSKGRRRAQASVATSTLQVDQQTGQGTRTISSLYTLHSPTPRVCRPSCKIYRSSIPNILICSRTTPWTHILLLSLQSTEETLHQPLVRLSARLV